MNSRKLAVSLFCAILFISLMVDTEGFVDYNRQLEKPTKVAKILCFLLRIIHTLLPWPSLSSLLYLLFSLLPLFYSLSPALPFAFPSSSLLIVLSSLPFFSQDFLPSFLPSFSFLLYSFIPICHCFYSCFLSFPLTVSSLTSFLAYGEMLHISEKPYI